MKFESLTDEQLQTLALIPDGVYSYRVIKAEDKISKAGNDYISLLIEVVDQNNKYHAIYTNLALIKLIKHFCDANGLEDNYKSGNLPSELCVGCSGGLVAIGIEKEKPNGQGGMYPAKNIVKDYIASAMGSSLQPIKPTTKALDEFVDDPLPF